MKIPRRSKLVATMATGIALATAAASFACTQVQGGTVIDSLPNGDRCGSPFSLTRPADCRTTELWAQITWPFQPVDSDYDGDGQVDDTRQYDFYPGVNPGDPVEAYGVGAREQDSQGNDILYRLFFLNHWRDTDEMAVCMSRNRPGNNLDDDPFAKTEVVIDSGANKADSTGRIDDDPPGSSGTVSGTIPTTAKGTNAITGPAAVCFMSVDSSTATETNEGYATNAAFLTVLP